MKNFMMPDMPMKKYNPPRNNTSVSNHRYIGHEDERSPEQEHDPQGIAEDGHQQQEHANFCVDERILLLSVSPKYSIPIMRRLTNANEQILI
jgi:hypothetical protein